MGKTKREVEEMLRKDDVIELNLSERKSNFERDDGELKIFNLK